MAEQTLKSTSTARLQEDGTWLVGLNRVGWKKGKLATEFKVGDTLLVHAGGVEKILGIEEKGVAKLIFKIRQEDTGKEAYRLVYKSRPLACKEMNKCPTKK